MNHAQICSILDSLIKEDKRYRIIKKISSILVPLFVIYLCWASLSVIQQFRYADNYNCVDMSKDCEAFFEGLGIRTQRLHGTRVTEDGSISGHCWLKVGFLEFESTTLLFSKVSDKYDVYLIDEGWIE